MPSVRTTKARPALTTTIITTTVQSSTPTSTQPDTTAFSTDHTTADSDELETSSKAFTTSLTTSHSTETTSHSTETTSKSILTSKLPYDGRLYCNAQTARDVQWPDTEPGLTAVMACPNNHNGKQKIIIGLHHLLQCQVKMSDFLLV